jgi:hypothetical protein
VDAIDEHPICHKTPTISSYVDACQSLIVPSRHKKWEQNGVQKSIAIW